MGSPAEEKQKIIDMMNQTLNNIEVMRRELSAKLDKENDENQAFEIKKELSRLESQATTVKGARDDFEQQYAKLKTEEERKKFERIVKMAIIVGITSESLRVAWEKQKQLEADRDAALRERETLRRERFEKAVDRIFATMTLRYVTRDMIEDIKNNKKFKEMAEYDPDRLNREEKVKQDEYTNMMSRKFRRYSVKMSGNFEQDEEKLRKILETEKSGYEKALPVLKDFIEKKLDSLGTEADKEFFITLLKDMQEINDITKKLNMEFITKESDFIKGNGFTKEIYEKEQSIKNRLAEKEVHALQEVMSEYEKGNTTDNKKADVYQTVLLLKGHVTPQVDEDEVLYKQNEFRKETECWQVYQRLPEGSVASVVSVSEKNKNELRAWAKINRLTRITKYEDRTTLLGCLCDWSRDNTQSIMDSIKKKNKYSANEKNIIKEKFASLVLFQLVYDEQKLGFDPQPFTAMVTKNNVFSKKEMLNILAKNIALTPEFDKAFNKYMKGGNYRDNCIKFLAEDAEKQLAKTIEKNVPNMLESLDKVKNLNSSKTVKENNTKRALKK
ncbi:MAG TPA: hypothetical protein DEO83_05030 [Lachnospiraceae bacterium]|nr:hypothetical protein [Lachnospiraceae bacterium]